ncbi:hypothetical protein DFJ73DRAFT_967062 [Zopfochytrium polystomum]|nr:hypothetical protein DFJ73DRAFT_967062 [Zopfochytrium polystomum]
MIVGDAVKTILGFDKGAKKKVDAKNHAGFNIYVRSDAASRRVDVGTHVVVLSKLPDDMMEVDAAAAPDAADAAGGVDRPPINPIEFMGPPAKHVQIAISFRHHWLHVKRFAKITIDKLLNVGSEKVEICVIAHGDYCDETSYYLMKSSGFKTSSGELVSFVSEVGRTGGGDAPEAYEYVLGKTLELPWDAAAQKSLIMLGDDLPHEDHVARYVWRDEVAKYAAQGIKIYAIQCGRNTRAKYFYETMANETDGIHLDLKDVGEITDFVLAIAYAEGNPRMIIAYQEELKKRGGGTLSDGLTKLFAKVTGKKGITLPSASSSKSGKPDASIYCCSAASSSSSTPATKKTPPTPAATAPATPVRVPRPLMRAASTLESSYSKIHKFSAEVLQVDQAISVGLFCPIYRINLKNKSLYVTYEDGMFIDDRIASDLMLYDEDADELLVGGDEVMKVVQFDRTRSYNVTYLKPKGDLTKRPHLQLLVKISDVQYMLKPGTLVLVK